MLATFAGCNVPPAVTNFPTAKLTLFPLTAKPSPEISAEFPKTLCIYNPQNETCDALKTKCARNKTKRFIPTKQNVPLNLCFYHSNIVFEWPAYIVRRPFL